MYGKLVVFACLFVAAALADLADLPDLPNSIDLQDTSSDLEQPVIGYNLPLLGVRIVGGVDARKGQFPYQVSLQWGMRASSTSHFCGGTILSSQWILTAGHCIQAVPKYGVFLVKAGKHNIKQVENGEQVVEVAKSIVHQSYKGGVAPFDIAMVKLKSPLKLNSAVAAASLPAANSQPTGTVTLSGWGSISKTSTAQMPAILQTAKLPIVDLNSCKKAVESLTGPSPLHETNVCTGPLTGGYSACSGDSGGPLVLEKNGKKEIIGVVSWGIMPCGSKGAPSVYSKVSSFVTWIGNIMAKN